MTTRRLEWPRAAPLGPPAFAPVEDAGTGRPVGLYGPRRPHRVEPGDLGRRQIGEAQRCCEETRGLARNEKVARQAVELAEIVCNPPGMLPVRVGVGDGFLRLDDTAIAQDHTQRAAERAARRIGFVVAGGPSRVLDGPDPPPPRTVLPP